MSHDRPRTPQQIGNLVRRARKKRDLSQTRLADKAGVRQETISLIETGNPAARLETMLAVLAALDLEFRIVARGKASAADIEDILLMARRPRHAPLRVLPQQGGNRRY